MQSNCIICGNSDFDKLIEVPKANFTASITRFNVIRCNKCGLAKMDPFPTKEDIEEIYIQNNTFSKPYKNPYAKDKFFTWGERLYSAYGDPMNFIVRKCKKLSLNKETPRVLDVGCSTGRLLLMFKSLIPNADLNGIEIDPNAIRRAPESIKNKIEDIDLVDYKPDQGFDIITFKVVIEHLLNPVEYIEHAVSLLNKGGILMMSTPDIDSADFRLHGADWRQLNDVRRSIGHVYWFNKKSMLALSKRVGLEIASCRNRGPLYPHLSPNIRKFLTFVLGTDPIEGRFIRHYPLRIIWGSIIDGLLSEKFGYGVLLFTFMKKN